MCAPLQHTGNLLVSCKVTLSHRSLLYSVLRVDFLALLPPLFLFRSGDVVARCEDGLGGWPPLYRFRSRFCLDCVWLNAGLELSAGASERHLVVYGFFLSGGGGEVLQQAGGARPVSP
jgi:hypothetical protein